MSSPSSAAMSGSLPGSLTCATNHATLTEWTLWYVFRTGPMSAQASKRPLRCRQAQDRETGFPGHSVCMRHVSKAMGTHLPWCYQLQGLLARTVMHCASATTGTSRLGVFSGPISTLGEMARAALTSTVSTSHLAGRSFTRLNSCPVSTCQPIILRCLAQKLRLCRKIPAAMTVYRGRDASGFCALQAFTAATCKQCREFMPGLRDL